MDANEREELAGNVVPTQSDSQSTYCETQEAVESQNMFPESPSYDLPTEGDPMNVDTQETIRLVDVDILSENTESNKRKLSDEGDRQNNKLKKIDSTTSPLSLDEEASSIWSRVSKRVDSPAPRKLLTPVRSSPRKITKRSNSCTSCSEDSQPRVRSRAASTDLTPAQSAAPIAPPPSILEENIDLNDSQTLHLELSSSWIEKDSETVEVKKPVGSVLIARHKTRLSNDRATDQDSTESLSSSMLDSPDAPLTLANKLITKLSNGDSSTPTDGSERSEQRAKNVTDATPSTISPLHNGKGGNLRSPREPAFDIHIGHDEDGELLSMYIVRTDHELAQDMAKEFNRLSKRFTLDPYMGDISKNSSPSSVLSGPPLPLPLPQPPRVSFTSTTSSSLSGSGSNRTSDGAFVVPPPPGKVGVNGTSGIQGYTALFRKIREILMPNWEEISRDETEDKTVQHNQQPHSTSNGAASPEEIARCDRATPKSSLKKTKGRGRRPLPGKTKRAILPTQMEEPEYQTTLNSPEMLPSGDSSSVSVTPIAVNSPRSRGRGRRPRAESPRPSPAPAPTTPAAAPAVTHPPGTLVLAKWIDKRYYSGKVQEELDGNKYQIEFDDGHSKTLSAENIIFGDHRQLPLRGQSVFVVVDEKQNYEPGLVLGVEWGEGGALYSCTTDGEATVCVMASELYMTEDQARSLAEPTPPTPRRRARDLHLDNIITGPRRARRPPASPQAGTSGTRSVRVSTGKRRQVSESSELSEGAPPPPPQLEEAVGVEPELHKTPRKIDGVRAGPLQLKGAARQTVGKKHSKLNQFENDDDTVSLLGPIPRPGSRLFAGLHFLLTCSGDLSVRVAMTETQPAKYNSDSEDTSAMTGSDHEDMAFSHRPFHKERLRVQLEAAGGTVYSHFDDLSKEHYPHTKLIAPRPCRTAKYIQCLAAGIRAFTHDWVIASCTEDNLCDPDSFGLPVGWSIMRRCFVTWRDRSDGSQLSGKTLALCGEQDTFVQFWSRVCSLAGIKSRAIDEEQIQIDDVIAVLTDPDCPHEVQNKANLDSIPLVSTQWLWQCVIEGEFCPPNGHAKFTFSYTEPD